MNLFDLLQSTNLVWSEITPKINGDIEVTDICTDSRKVKKGSLFIALEGSKADGHLYLKDAEKASAAALIVNEKAVKDGRVKASDFFIPIFSVNDTRLAAAWLYSAWCGHPQRSLTMIGVTGTNGKTSIARLIREILAGSGRPCGVIGTVGCYSPKGKIDLPSPEPDANMTTPDPGELYPALAQMKADGAAFVVMEVSSHALALEKVEPITFDIAIFTNLTEDHLDFHGDMEHYYLAKEKLFSQCKTALINIDDRYGKRLYEKHFCHSHACSAEGKGAAFVAEDIRLKGERGIEYKISSPGLRMRVRSPLVGSFQVMNTLEASACAKLLGVKIDEIRAALLSFYGVSGRLERVKLPHGQDYQVYIDYAHTPDALENTLRTARGFLSFGQRLWVVFGCGGDRDRQKRPIMGNIAASLADVVIITSDNSRGETPSEIIKDIISGIGDGGAYTVIENRQDAIEYAVARVGRGDMLLLCGKGHEEYEIGAEGKKPFSEKAIVYSAAMRRAAREGKS